jgi:hypothetical protein
MQFLTQMLHLAGQLLARGMQWLQLTFNTLQASPHRLMFYALGAAVALLLISAPLLRIFSARHDEYDEKDTEVRSYSVLGIGPSLVPAADRRVPEFPRWIEVVQATKREPVAEPPQPAPNVTPIHPSSTALCTHCGATLSAHEDFCPACGYAQPTQQSVAGFPA